MSRAIARHMRTIREQRKILDGWTAYEYDLNKYWFGLHQAKNIPANVIGLVNWNSLFATRLEDFLPHYHQNLDVAESRLKAAASRGGVLDITDTPLGHDLRCVSNPTMDSPKADKLRIRANLVRLDFYERFGRLPEVHTYKLTIPHVVEPKPDAAIVDLALAIQVPRYEPVVLASFLNQADAMLYRLGI